MVLWHVNFSWVIQCEIQTFLNNYNCQDLEYTKCVLCRGVISPPHTLKKRDVLGMTLNCIWWWGSRSWDLQSVEFLFIAITPQIKSCYEMIGLEKEEMCLYVCVCVYIYIYIYIIILYYICTYTLCMKI